MAVSQNFYAIFNKNKKNLRRAARGETIGEGTDRGEGIKETAGRRVTS